MGTLFIDFNAKCTLPTIYKLFEIINEIPSTRIIFRISSIGGNCFGGLIAFNKLNAISKKVELVTYNASSIEGSALPMFYAGNKRYATSNASFYLNSNLWSQDSKDVHELIEAYKKATAIDNSLIRIFKCRKDLANINIEDKYYNSKIITIKEALESKLVHEIRENILEELDEDNYYHFIISNDSEDKPIVQRLR